MDETIKEYLSFMIRTKEDILAHLEKKHRYYLQDTPRPDEPATAYKILHDCAELIPFPELDEDEFLDTRFDGTGIEIIVRRCVECKRKPDGSFKAKTVDASLLYVRCELYI